MTTRATTRPRLPLACAAPARVRFRRHEQNRGHIDTYNESLAEDTGDYVVLLSGDDLLAPGALQRAQAVFQANPSTRLVYGHAIAIYKDNPPPACTRPTSATVWRGHEWIGFICRAGRNFNFGDMEMWLRAATVADLARINRADQAHYHIHSLSMQRTTHAGMPPDLAGRLEASHIPSVNEGMRHVSGDCVVKLDADDILAPGCLARICAFLEACPEVGFVYGRPGHFGASVGAAESRLHRLPQRASYLATDESGVERLDFRVRGWTLWAGVTWIERVCARGANCISQPEAVMRAQTLRAARAYGERLPHTSDLNMWLRLATLVEAGHIAGAVQGSYLEHAGSMQPAVKADRPRDFRGRLDAFESALGGSAGPLPRAPELLALARAKLASEALEQACHAFDRGRTASQPIDVYVAFALQAHAGAPALPQWRLLKRRRRMGVPTGSQWYPPFLVQTALRRALGELRAAHWRRHGV